MSRPRKNVTGGTQNIKQIFFSDILQNCVKTNSRLNDNSKSF